LGLSVELLNEAEENVPVSSEDEVMLESSVLALELENRLLADEVEETLGTVETLGGEEGEEAGEHEDIEETEQAPE